MALEVSMANRAPPLDQGPPAPPAAASYRQRAFCCLLEPASAWHRFQSMPTISRHSALITFECPKCGHLLTRDEVWLNEAEAFICDGCRRRSQLPFSLRAAICERHGLDRPSKDIYRKKEFDRQRVAEMRALRIAAQHG